ncbi:MAG TPA: carbohydrate binding family 9 domain-containing protein, partial [Longimicrobiales bacterium]
MQRSGLVWLALLCAATPLAAQEAQPIAKASSAARITAQRAGESPKVDGRLDEALWQSARWLSDFVQREPHEGQPATERTEVAIFYDEDALYIGARMHSSDPAGVRALVTRRDREESSEQLLVSLDTYLDRRTAYSFGVTAAGVRIDYYHAGDHEGNRHYSYDPVWQAETQRHAGGWTAEIRIPFTQLRFNAGPEQQWGINIVRSTPARNEIAFWQLVGRNQTGWASRMGLLVGIQGIRPSRR